MQDIISSFETNWIDIVLVIFIMAVVVFIIRFAANRTRKVMYKKIGSEKKELIGRYNFLINMILKILIGLNIIIGVLIILNLVGLPVSLIILVFILLSVLVGFGVQSTIKDIVSGGFIVIEKWFKVNDIITVGGDINMSGKVEKFGLRTTEIRDLNGVVHHIPNSEIRVLSNKTKNWSNAVVKVGIHYRENIDEAIEVLETVFDDIINDSKYKKFIIEKPEILGNGVDELDDSAVTFKIICKVKPGVQWDIERQLRKRIKNKFDEVGIEIPFPCRNIYMKSS